MANGPATITIREFLTKDDDFCKFIDNQNRRWNCDISDIVNNLGVGLTIDAWWDERAGSFDDKETGKTVEYVSKYIVKAAPSDNPPQDLKPEYKGGSGSKGGGGGGSKKSGDGDFRTSGELIVIDALSIAEKMFAGIVIQRVKEGEALDSVARTVRVEIQKTADVFCEYIREQGQRLGKSSEVNAAWAPKKDEAPAQTTTESAGWSAKPVDADADIPF